MAKIHIKSIGRARFSHSLTDDLKMIIRTLTSNDDPHNVIQFEKQFALYTGREICVTFSMARTALYFVLRGLEAQPGEKILMPPITIKALLDVVLDAKLIPVFADLNLSTGCFDADDLKSVIEKEKPAYCLLTYLYGISPEMEAISNVLSENNVTIIEDFSQGLNLGPDSEIWSGRVGKVSIYSASNIKTLDSYGGGFTVTDDLALANKLRDFQSKLKFPKKSQVLKKVIASFIKNFASSPLCFNLITFPIIRFFSLLRLNNFDRFVGNRSIQPIQELPEAWFYRLSGHQAGAALRYLPSVRSVEKARKNYAEFIFTKIHDLNIVGRQRTNESVFWQLIVILDDHEEFRSFLRKKGIDSAYSSLINISKLPLYGIDGVTPNAERLYACGVYIPCYASLSTRDKIYISKVLHEYQQRSRAA